MPSKIDNYDNGQMMYYPFMPSSNGISTGDIRAALRRGSTIAEGIREADPTKPTSEVLKVTARSHASPFSVFPLLQQALFRPFHDAACQIARVQE